MIYREFTQLKIGVPSYTKILRCRKFWKLALRGFRVDASPVWNKKKICRKTKTFEIG